MRARIGSAIGGHENVQSNGAEHARKSNYGILANAAPENFRYAWAQNFHQGRRGRLSFLPRVMP